MRRWRRRVPKRPVADKAAFEHSSHRTDLEALLADHMIDSASAPTMNGWLPSRRGNSPRST